MDWSLTNPGLIYNDQQIDPTTGMPVPRVKFFPNVAARSQQYAKDASQAVQPSSATVEGRFLPPDSSGGAGQEITAPATGAPPTPVLPQMFKPKFQDVSQGPYGLPTPINPAETKLGKLLHVLRAVGQGMAAGSQAGTFGGGYEAAQQEPYQDAARKVWAQNAILENQFNQARLANLPWQNKYAKAKAEADLAELQGKAKTAGLIPTRTGQIYNAATGQWIPGNLPTGKEGTIDQQAADYLETQVNPDTGKLHTPFEALTKVAQAKQDVKPDPQASLKADFQALTSKIADEISPDAMSSLPKFTAVVNRSGKLTAEEKRRVVSYVAANSTPMSQGSTANLRIAGLAETRGMPVTDTKTGVTAPMSWADYNTLRKAEPGRYVSPQYDADTQMSVRAWRDLAPGGKTGTQITSYNTFLRHVGDMYDAIDELKNSKYQDWNKPMNWLSQHSGDPRVQRFLAKLEPVQKEFESFLLNNRALYSEDREDAKRLLDQNSSPAAMYGVAESLVHTGHARLDELNNSFKRATGEDIPNIISPEAQAAQQKVSPSTGKKPTHKYAPGFSPL